MRAQQRGLQLLLHEQLYGQSHTNDFWTCCPISTILREGQWTKKKITLLLSQWKISRRKEKERKSSTSTKGKAAVWSSLLCLNCQDVLCCWLIKADVAPCPRPQEQAGHYREGAEGGLRGNTKLKVTVRKFKEHGEEQQDCVGGCWNREALWILWGRITKKGSERAVAGRGGHCRDTEDLALQQWGNLEMLSWRLQVLLQIELLCYICASAAD